MNGAWLTPKRNSMARYQNFPKSFGLHVVTFTRASRPIPRGVGVGVCCNGEAVGPLAGGGPLAGSVAPGYWPGLEAGHLVLDAIIRNGNAEVII